MAVIALASCTGPRTTGNDTVVARVIDPESPTTAARAVGPSSHGDRKNEMIVGGECVEAELRRPPGVTGEVGE